VAPRGDDYHVPVTTDPLGPEEIQRRLRPLFGRPGLRLVLLFGSRASGRARPSSDVDLGILGGGDPAALTVEAIRLLGTDRVDVVDLARASPLLAMAAARTGRPLHEGEAGAFAGFVSLAVRRYHDTAKLRRAREAGLKAFLESRGL